MRTLLNLAAAIALGCGSTTGSTTAESASSGATSSGSGGGGDSWTSYAKDFFATYCVECHDAKDTTGRDFTQYAVVAANAPTIRCGVAPVKESGCGASPQPKQFPISDGSGTNPKPSDAERARIVAWIDAGAKM